MQPWLEPAADKDLHQISRVLAYVSVPVRPVSMIYVAWGFLRWRRESVREAVAVVRLLGVVTVLSLFAACSTGHAPAGGDGGPHADAAGPDAPVVPDGGPGGLWDPCDTPQDC